MDTSTQAVRRTLAVLLLGVSLSAAACSSSSTGEATATAPVLQTIPEGQFTAEFPKGPVRDQEKISAAGLDLLMISYSVDLAKESVVVGWFDYPKTVQMSTPKLLAGAADGSAASAHGTIVSKTETTFMGHPAMDVVIDTKDGRVYERIIHRGNANRVYVLVGAGPAGSSGKPATWDRLMATFVLL